MSKTHRPASVPSKPLRLLFAEDDPNDLELCLRDLEKSGLNFQADSAFTLEEFARKLREEPADVVISDYRMKGWTAIDALAMIQESWPGVPLILVSGTLGDELAVECMKKGITDYLLKGQLARLPMAIQHAREGRALREAETRALDALRESEEHYRTLVENAPEAIVLLDLDQRKFVDPNGRALSLFGLTRDALQRSGVRDVSATTQVDGATAETMERLFSEPGVEKGTARFEWMYRNSQGEEHPAEVYVVRLPSANRRLVRASIVDITERKRSEQALRDSEARYRGLVDNATYGILWVEEHGGRLLDANPAVAAMLRYDSVDDLLSIQFTKTLYCNPDDQTAILAEYRRLGRAHATVEWKRKDGKVVAVRLSSRRTMNSDGSECAEVFVEDVTEHKTLERQLVQAQKFEAIGQLAGGIAHDFNNMIGAIIGWVDLGLDEAPADSRLHQRFQKIRQQAERAAALTRQLLAFARRQILEPRNVDLNQTSIETLSLLEKVIGSNIEIKANLAPDLAVVRADPTQVEQVLMNLCINARDAMPNGGSLIIDTSNIALDAAFCSLQPLARPGDYVMLAITDSGTGMDAATLDRIFEPFFTTKEMGKGTGLGLATVYGIVRQHGGFLNVYSEPGVGSTFRVYLPISTTAAPARDSAEDPGPVAGGTETILVAEDHEGLRQLAQETLTGLGYNVLLAADGEQALQEFQRSSETHLAVLDVVMPKLSGPEVYARLQETHPSLPVIFATGYSPDLAMIQKVQQQGFPVLQKPYSSRSLARAVRKTLDTQARPVSND